MRATAYTNYKVAAALGEFYLVILFRIKKIRKGVELNSKALTIGLNRVFPLSLTETKFRNVLLYRRIKPVKLQ